MRRRGEGGGLRKTSEIVREWGKEWEGGGNKTGASITENIALSGHSFQSTAAAANQIR